MKKRIVKKDGKNLRGISRNKICVATGICKDCSLLIATKVSKLNDEVCLAAYESHIMPNSHLIHDLEKSHNVLVRSLKLQSSAYDSSLYKNIKDEENPLAPINEFHRLLKTFMSSHSVYDRDELQNWLNLFWFISNGPKDRYDKVLLFIEIAIKTRKK